jgi:Zn-dependent protease
MRAVLFAAPARRPRERAAGTPKTLGVYQTPEPAAPRPEAVEGEYLGPTANPASGRNWGKTAGGAAVGFGLLLAKFKTFAFALLNLKWLLLGSKFLISGGSFLLSIWFYALFFGWKFGIVFVLLIALHEAGHVIFMRAVGLPGALPYFIPGLGAFTTMGPVASVYEESLVAFGGPLLGTIGGGLCFAFGFLTGNPFWYAAAYTAFFLNLFNMLPVGFLDGGRMIGAISPRVWAFGLVLLVVTALAFHWWSPVLLLVVLFSVPRAIAGFRGRVDPRYFGIPRAQRVAASVAYFGLLAVLAAATLASRIAVPAHAFN